jgi:hypothetical protein
MPIRTRGNDILISFSYEYPIGSQELKMDFSLLYQDDTLMLKVKNGSKNLGTFPVVMFQEVLDFLLSKGYLDTTSRNEETTLPGIGDHKAVDDILDSMSSNSHNSSDNSDNIEHSEESLNSSSDASFDSPIQSFSINTQKHIKSSSDINESSVDGDIISVDRFRDDINYVDPHAKLEDSSSAITKGTTIKRKT